MSTPDPDDDRQQVQSRRATSLAAIQTAKYPRDALYALLRTANQDVLRILSMRGLTSEGTFTVSVEVRTTARPQGSTDVSG